MLNRINRLNTTTFLLDTAHQKEDLIHKLEFFTYFMLSQTEFKCNYKCCFTNFVIERS